MSKFIRGFLGVILILSSIALIALSTTVVSFLDYKENQYVPIESKIISTDEITVYVNQKYTLTPYILNGNNEIEVGDFVYRSNTPDVSVNENGYVYVNKMPTTQCIITITDKKYDIQKEIKVNVLSGVSDIFDVVPLTELRAKYGESISFRIDYTPVDLAIENYITYKTVDVNSNEVKDVMVLEVEKNIATFKAVGLGRGRLNIKIKDFEAFFDFDISLENETLSYDIVEDKLLNKNDIQNIKSVYYSGTLLNIDDLYMFTSLRNIALSNEDSVCYLNNFSSNYTYYVPTKMYESYFRSTEYGDPIRYLEPYEDEINKYKFVIYHDKTKLLSCEKINDSFSFKTLTAIGYNHVGEWSETESGTQKVLIDTVKNLTVNSIHLYSMWNPNKYTVEYHSTISGTDKKISSISCTYGEKINLEKLSSLTKEGYIFVGWDSNNNSSSIISESDVHKVEYNMLDKTSLTIDSLSSINNDVIKIYDVWRPIKYEVRFEKPANAKAEAQNLPSSITLYYDTTYNLKNNNHKVDYFTITGYTISKWSSKNGDVITSSNPSLKNLSSKEGEVVTLIPTLTAKSYTVKLKLPSDYDMNNIQSGTMNEYVTSVQYDKTLNTASWKHQKGSNATANFNLKYAPLYSGYSWFIDFNNDNNQDTNEPSVDPSGTSTYVTSFSLKDFEYMNIDSKTSSLTICPSGLSASYYLTVNLDGGSIGGTTVPNNRMFEIESANYTIKSPTKSNYSHKGWEIKVTNSAGKVKQTIETNNLTIKLDKTKIDGHTMDKLESGDKIIVTALYDRLYKLILNSAGGTSTEDIIELKKDDLIPNIEIPIRPGYIFEGYYLNDTLFIGVDGVALSKFTYTKDIEVVAKWKLYADSVTFSEENGKRNIDIVYSALTPEIIQFSKFNKAELKEAGFTKVKLTITITCRQIKDFVFSGTNQIRICEGTSGIVLQSIKFDNSSSNWETSTFTYEFDIDKLLTDNHEFKVYYSSVGIGSYWTLGTTVYSIEAVK